MQRTLLGITAVTVLGVALGHLASGRHYWIGPDNGDWRVNGNWSTNSEGTPNTSAPDEWQNIAIERNGIALVSAGVARGNSTTIGLYTGDNAVINVTGGTLWLGYVGIGAGSGALGTLNVSGGTLRCNDMYFGRNQTSTSFGGRGTMNHSGGTVIANNIDLTRSEEVGRYLMSGPDSVLTMSVTLALANNNVFEQDGGTSAIGDIRFQGGVATLRLKSGSMTVINTAGIRHTSTAGTGYVFELGETGVAELRESTPGTLLNVGYATGSGTRKFQGAGVVGFTGELQNNGQVIADGWDGVTERTLDLSSFTSVSGDTSTTPTRGWWARNKAELLLPTVTVAAGNNSYSWGEADAVSLPHRVNALRLDFTNAMGGDLDIALLAPGRAELGTTTGDILGLWRFDPGPGLAFDSLNLTVRYDTDSVLAGMGLLESDLKLYKTVNDVWTDVTGLGASVVLNTTTNRLTVSGLTSFSYFAIGDNISGIVGLQGPAQVVPEPGALSLLLLVGATVLGRRRRR